MKPPILGNRSHEDSPGVDSHDTEVYYNAEGEERPTTTMDTLTGKIKTFCPSLYFSLSSWERDAMDSSTSLGKGNSLDSLVEPLLDHVGMCPTGSVSTPLVQVGAQISTLPKMVNTRDCREKHSGT
jgi:hypothetical protein